MRLDPIQANIWRSEINTGIGSALLVTCALLAAIVMWQAATGTNPVVTAFAEMVAKETQLK